MGEFLPLFSGRGDKSSPKSMARGKLSLWKGKTNFLCFMRLCNG